jgi:hypothetical protein
VLLTLLPCGLPGAVLSMSFEAFRWSAELTRMTSAHSLWDNRLLWSDRRRQRAHAMTAIEHTPCRLEMGCCLEVARMLLPKKSKHALQGNFALGIALHYTRLFVICVRPPCALGSEALCAAHAP